MRNRPRRAVTFVLAIMLLLLPVVAVLQFHLLDRAGEAEAARLQRIAGNAARQIRVEIAYELSSLLALISQWSFDPVPDGDLLDTLRTWSSRARFPGLVDQVVVVLSDGADGTRAEYRRTGADMEFVRVSEPTWLRAAAGSEAGGAQQALAYDDPMVLRVPMFRAVGPEGAVRLAYGPPADGAPASFIRLDRFRLTQTVLPALVSDHLGADRDGFQAALVDLATQELLYASSPVAYTDFEGLSSGRSEAGPGLVPSEVVPLIGVPAVEAIQAGLPEIIAQSPVVQQWMMLRSLGERGTGSHGRETVFASGHVSFRDRTATPISGLSLVIWHPAGSVERAATDLRNRNLVISLLILGAFAGAAILFHSLYLRAHRQREREQEFVASVTHELRTPLAAMHAVAENLAEGIVTREERVREYGAALLDESRRLRAMIDQTLLYAGLRGRLRAGAQPVDPGDLAQRIADATTDVSPGQLEVDIAPGLPPYRGEENAIAAILTNLLTNAVKHNPCGIAVRLRVSRETRGRREWLVMVVADEGAGIPRSELRHVREAFYRGSATAERQTPGTGLGLSIVERLVAARRGQLLVESRRGEGTRVTVRLPYER